MLFPIQLVPNVYKRSFVFVSFESSDVLVTAMLLNQVYAIKFHIGGRGLSNEEKKGAVCTGY